MRQRGYIQKRRAILDHLRSKKMTDAEYIVFDALLILADDSCGIVKDTTPVQIAAAMGRGVSSIQHTLRTLEEKSYIRRDMKLGSNKPYSILIDKLTVLQGRRRAKC
jgi:DNA-binding MarR family transcriptional regulator